MTDEELIAMARLAQRDDRMSTGALYGNLSDRIEALRAALDEAEAALKRTEENRDAVLADLHETVAERDAANALLQLADDALDEAEAILGGEYGDYYATLCETMIKLRGQIAALAHLGAKP